MPRTSRQQTGFTLIELMFVVLLIGLMAAMIAPRLSSGRRDAEIANFATQLVRLGSRARAQAQASGLAHTLVVDTAGVITTVRLFRGTSARCNLIPWNWANNPPLDQMRTNEDRYVNGGVSLQLAPVDNGAANIRICTQPNGVTLLRVGDPSAIGGFTPSIAGAGGPMSDIEFRLFHGVSFTQRTGAERRVVFPSGNIPRWAQ